VVRLPEPAPAGKIAQRLADQFTQLGQPGVAFYGDAHRVVRTLGLGTGYANDPFRHYALGAELVVTIDDRIKTWCEPVWAEDSGHAVIAGLLVAPRTENDRPRKKNRSVVL
jgi:hypothetical protein